MAGALPEGRRLMPGGTAGEQRLKQLRDLPVLENELFRMRPVRLSDAGDMFEYGSDPEVVKHLPWGPYRNIGEVRAGIRDFFLTRPEKGIPAAYAILWKETGRMIGTCDFHSVDVGRNAGGVGFVLNRLWWNRGIITRAAGMLMDMGRTRLGYDMATLAHVPDNTAAARVAQKLGFTETGRREHRFMDGQESRMMVHYEKHLN